jgi:hypothetical protein
MGLSRVVATSAMCVGVLLMMPGIARGAESCGRASQPHVLSGHEALVFFLGGIPEAPTGQLVVTIDVAGSLTAKGTVHVPDGQSNRVVTDKGFGFVEMTCADIDADGFPEVTALQLIVREIRSSDSFPLTIVPVDGGIGEGDDERVIVVIGNATFLQMASVLFAP